MSNPALTFDHIHIIAADPEATVKWYVEMFGADVTANTKARGAAQIVLEIGGTIIIVRGKRPGEHPTAAKGFKDYSDFSSKNEWGTDHFGVLYHGDLTAFCDGLRAKGVTFPVALKKGVNGSLLCYVQAPDGVSIELMQA